MKLLTVLCFLVFALLLAGRGSGEWFSNDAQEQYGPGGGQQQQQQGEQNPYVFEDHHFQTRVQTQHGRVRVLPRFTQRSELHRGIDNYRFAVLEADPNTFIIPHHMDAESVIFVAHGNGAVSFLREDDRESFNIRRGDIFRIPAGTTTYLINRDNNHKLVLAKLLQPVSTPGHFENFFGAGGENPQSFFKAFSNEILEAAFNTRGEKLQRLFGQQRQGVIIRASEQQIKALSQHEGTGGIWPFRGESQPTFNIFDKRPTHSNQFGQVHEVQFNDYRQLQDLNVAISHVNVTRGGMTSIVYSSKAAKVGYIVSGEGYFEMACPHLFAQGQQRRQGSQQQQQQQQGQEYGGPGSQRQQGSQQGQGGYRPYGTQQETQGPPQYQKVSAPLRRGTVFIIPPGHPVVSVASQNQNLEVVFFEINAFNNRKFPLAGRRNVFNQLERQAKELAFGVSAREVDEVFNSQQEEYFFRGPRQQQQQQQQQEGRAVE